VTTQKPAAAWNLWTSSNAFYQIIRPCPFCREIAGILGIKTFVDKVLSFNNLKASGKLSTKQIALTRINAMHCERSSEAVKGLYIFSFISPDCKVVNKQTSKLKHRIDNTAN